MSVCVGKNLGVDDSSDFYCSNTSFCLRISISVLRENCIVFLSLNCIVFPFVSHLEFRMFDSTKKKLNQNSWPKFPFSFFLGFI